MFVATIQRWVKEGITTVVILIIQAEYFFTLYILYSMNDFSDLID